MGLREIGKAVGTSGDVPAAPRAPATRLGQALSSAGDIANQITRMVTRVKEVARGF